MNYRTTHRPTTLRPAPTRTLNLPHESYVVASSSRSYNGSDRNTLLDGFMRTFVVELRGLLSRWRLVSHPGYY